MEHEIEKTLSLAVTGEDSAQRIDSFIAAQIEDLTRSRVQELVKRGFVQVNGHSPKTSYRLKKGDLVTLSIPPVQPYALEPEPVDFTLVYEDPSLIVLNKPPGLVVHPAPGHSTGTLVHGLLHHCRDLSGVGGVLRPGIVHRLDKDTSGVLVAAKNDHAHNSLARQFKAGTITKRYLALVHGTMKAEQGEIALPIGRHPRKRKEMAVLRTGGRKAYTGWMKLMELGNRFSLLEVSPKTGRTHQIRVHLAHLRHPIVGDPLYGYKKRLWKKHFPMDSGILPLVKRQMLHAQTLGFVHPDKGEYCEFRVPAPPDMERLIEALGGMEKKTVQDKRLDTGKD